MSESINKIEQPSETQNKTENSPQDYYNQLLKGYVDCSQTMRNLYNSKRTGENADLDKLKLINIDSGRHDIHEELNKLGTTFGKSPEQIISDILSEEGNLKEIGIDAPVIRLPLLGVMFKLDEKNQKIQNPNPNDLHLPNQRLLTSEGKRLATIDQSYYPTSYLKVYGEEYSGDKSEIDKWNKKPFYSIVFAFTQDSNGVFFQPDYPLLYETRIKRMYNLAKDFNLNIFNAYDVSGHQDYGSRCIEGIEVFGQDLEKIGLAMINHPEKYWLTPDELKDPYKRELMEKESPKYLDAYVAKTINLNKPEYNKWEDWYNFLRLYDVLSKNDSQPKNSYTFYKKFINQAIKEASLENKNIASEMKSLTQKNFPPNNKISP